METKQKFKTDIVNRYMHNEGFGEMAQSENCSVNDIWEYLKKQSFKEAFEKMRGRGNWIDGRFSDDPDYHKKYYQKHRERIMKRAKKYNLEHKE